MNENEEKEENEDVNKEEIKKIEEKQQPIKVSIGSFFDVLS